MSAPVVKFKVATTSDSIQSNNIKLIEFDILKTKHELDKKILFEKQKLESAIVTTIQNARVINETNLINLIDEKSLESLTGLKSFTDVSLSNYANNIDSKLATMANKNTLNALDEFFAVIDSSMAFQGENAEIEFKYSLGGSFTGVYIGESDTGSSYVVEITEAEFLQFNSTTGATGSSTDTVLFGSGGDNSSGYINNSNPSSSDLQSIDGSTTKFYYSPKLKMYFAVSTGNSSASRVVLNDGTPISSKEITDINNITSMNVFLEHQNDLLSNKNYIGFEDDLTNVLNTLQFDSDSTLWNEFLDLPV
jgi:hypothetical protein